MVDNPRCILGQDTITPKGEERSKGHLRKNSSSNRPNMFEVPAGHNRRYFARPGTKVKHQPLQTVQIPSRVTNRMSQNSETLALHSSKDELSLSQIPTVNLTVKNHFLLFRTNELRNSLLEATRAWKTAQS